MATYKIVKNFNYDARDFKKGARLRIDDSTALMLMKHGWVEPENLGDPIKENKMAHDISKSSLADGLEALAELRKAEGETVEAAMLRLLRTDPAAAGMLKAHDLAQPATLADLQKAYAKTQPAEDPEDQPDLAEIEEAAKSICKRDGCSEAEGYLKAITANPDAYQRLELRKADRASKIS